MMQTKDFKGQDLRGRSFKNQDLTGADFSDCDLRGVDFSFANLTDAKFCNARMGRTKTAALILLVFQFLIGLLSGFLVTLSISFTQLLAESFLESLKAQIVFLIFYQSLLSGVLLLSLIKQRWSYMVGFFAFTIARGGSIFIAGVISGAVVVTMTIAVVGAVVGAVVVAGAVVIALVSVGSGSSIGIGAGIGSGISYAIVGIYLGKRAISREELSLLFLRNWGVKFACWHGTEFTFANLNQVDFSNTDLKYTRFKNAKISNCNFHNAKNHHLALTENTPLEPRKIRDLVIDGIITDKNFATLDLRGLDFSHLNLQNFDFSHANLSGANLSHTQLTGAILEGWSIDTETRLDDIECRYYYYLENGAKKRMPPEGEEYSPGEFTRIFQKIANTIDFIAHNEMELAAIKLSVEQVRVESGNDDIRVRAIEEKDGFIVVKVTVPKTEDRGVLYHEVNVLKQDYETQIKTLTAKHEGRIEGYESEIANLREDIDKQRTSFLKDIKPSIVIKNSKFKNKGILILGETNGNVTQQNTK